MSDPSTLWHYREGPPFHPGDVILPGRWGSTVITLGAQHALYYRESLLEMVRRVDFDHLPSRLQCTFAYKDISVAGMQGQGKHLYRVEPDTRDRSTTEADINWLDLLGLPGRTFDAIARDVHGYWSGQPSSTIDPQMVPRWEVLILGGLRVLERVV